MKNDVFSRAIKLGLSGTVKPGGLHIHIFIFIFIFLFYLPLLNYTEESLQPPTSSH